MQDGGPKYEGKKYQEVQEKTHLNTRIANGRD